MLADLRHRFNVLASGDNQAEGPAVNRPLGILSNLSWQTWAYVALTAALIAGAGVRFRNPGDVILVSVYIAVFVACAATDLASFRVLNALTYPSILLALAVGALIGDFKACLIGGGIALGFMLAALLISRGAMGLGDVKLVTFAGLAVGWPAIGDALLLMAISGGVVAVVLLATRIRGRRDPIPYAPFISAATIAVILWQGTTFARF